MENKDVHKSETFYPKNRQEWRNWLIENHNIKDYIWLIYYKKNSNKPSISYNEAVDSKSYMQFFSKRKESSVWSKINKEKVKKLMDAGLMDSLVYHYQSGNNQLLYVDDNVNSSNYNMDIDDQSAGNYRYDLIGNLVEDNAEEIDTILWNVYGKSNL